MRAKLVLVAKVFLLFGILGWVIYRFPREDWLALREQPKDWGILILSLALVLACNILSFLRWMMLVRALEVPFRIIEAIRLGFLGCLFNLVSAGSVGGDLFKAVAAARSKPSKRPEVVASVVVDRAFGLLALIVVSALSLQFLGGPDLPVQLKWIKGCAWTIVGVSSIALIGVIVAGRKLPIHVLSRMPWIGHSLYRMARSCLLFYGRPGLTLAMLLSSMFVHTGLTTSMFAISKSLYAETPSFRQHFLAIPPAIAAGALPLTPGGMGVQEVAVNEMFRELPNIPIGFSGLIVAAMYRMITFVVAGIGAIFYFTGYGHRDSQATP